MSSNTVTKSGLYVVSLIEALWVVLLAVVLLASLVLFVVHHVYAIGHPYGLDYGEAPLVDQALRLAAGKTLYRSDLSSPPYTISNYPPLYVLALTPFVALWGPNYWGGRLLSTLSALATALFLGLMVYRAFRQRLAALLTASIFCVIPYVSGWSSLLRIDLLALALSTAALYVLMVAPARRAQLVAGAVLLTAAAYTRQSYALAAPLAGFVWLWTQAGRKPAFKLAGLVASMGLLLFVLLNVTTDGGFYFNVVTANVNEFGWERLGRHLSALWSTLPVLAAIGALALAVLPVARAHFWPLVVAYSVGAFLSSLTIGKIGSNVNYFMELCAALSLATGMLVGWARDVKPGHWRRWLGVVLLGALCWQSARMVTRNFDDFLWVRSSRFDQVDTLAQLESLATQAGGAVIGDEYMGLVLRAGESLYIQPFEITQLAWAGLWDQTDFVSRLEAGEFPLVMIHVFPGGEVFRERWTAEMLAAIEREYKLVGIFAGTRAYRPLSYEPPQISSCPSGLWPFPSAAGAGIQVEGQTLSFLGRGNGGEIPVVAVADGSLTRLEDWGGTVVIRHADPRKPGTYVWAVYTGMLHANGVESYIAPEFPLGSAGAPVQAGQLLGYQGTWSGKPNWPAWVHVRFAVVPEHDGAPPDWEVLLPNLLPEAGRWEGAPLAPLPYFGLDADPTARRVQPVVCGEE